MTQSYLSQKKIEERFGKNGIPTSTGDKMKTECAATGRMTNILKKMYSPRNFATPNSFQPSGSALLSQNDDYNLLRQKNHSSLADSLLEESAMGAFLREQRSNFDPKTSNAKF